MSADRKLKAIVATSLLALLLAGCVEYRCVDGRVQRRGSFGNGDGLWRMHVSEDPRQMECIPDEAKP